MMISMFGTYIDWNYQNDLMFSMWNGSSQQTLLRTATPYSLNVLNHTVATFDGTDKKLYNNGQFLISAGDIAPATSISTLYIGKFTGGNHNCNGKILTARIYNRSLSANEVQQNFNVTRKRFGI